MDVPYSTNYCQVALRKFNVPGRVVESTHYEESPQPTIVLILLKGQAVGHFVCTWTHGTSRHFFCPYGKPASFYGMSADFSNPTPLQATSFYSDGVKAVATCAKHCLMRLKMRDMSHSRYAAWLGPNADVTVHVHA